MQKITVGCVIGFNESNVLTSPQHLTGNSDQPNPRYGGKEQVASVADNGTSALQAPSVRNELALFLPMRR